MNVLKDDFLTRWAEALRRRLRPQTTLEIKQFAAAIGIRYETALRWLRGDTGPSGDTVAAAVAFFDGRGDRRFRDELFPTADATRWEPAEDRDRKLIAKVLEELGVVRIPRTLWFTETGDIKATPMPLGSKISDFAPAADSAADSHTLQAFGRGSIAVRVNAGRWQVEYAENAIAGGATQRLLAWLSACTSPAPGTSIARRVLVESHWVEVEHPTLSSLSSAIEAAPLIAANAKGRRNRVIRLPLEAAGPKLGPIVAALNTRGRASSAIWDVAQNSPHRDCIGIFRLEGHGESVSVRLIHSGPGMGVPKSTALGRELRERADLAYVLPLLEEVQRADADNEPACYDRQVSINGRPYDYLNVKMPGAIEKDGTRLVMTASYIRGARQGS